MGKERQATPKGTQIPMTCGMTVIQSLWQGTSALPAKSILVTAGMCIQLELKSRASDPQQLERMAFIGKDAVSSPAPA